MRTLDRLLARDRLFFEAFDALAARLTESARLLAWLFADEPARRAERMRAIAAVVGDAARIGRDVRLLVDRALITPFDPDDMLRLAWQFTAAVDRIDGIARRVVDFHVTGIPPVATRLVDVLVAAGKHLEAMMHDIRRPERVFAHARLVKQCEEEADALHAEAVGALFASRPAAVGAIEVLKWKELYDQLETALDDCEDVTEGIETISVRRA